MNTPTQTRLTREEVSFRRAAEQDRATIEYIASKTWDGDDYLADIFDKWLVDPHGAFNVMTYRDAVVATSKLTKLGEGEWWMEGLRVHPDYQGRGLARIMHHYIVNQARQQGEGVVRFATASENTIVHRLAGETGFRLVGDFIRLYAPATPHPASWWQLGPDDFEAFNTWLGQNDHFQDIERSFEFRWRLQIGTPAILRQILAEGRAYGWSPNGDTTIGGLFVINPPHPDRPETMSFGFAHTPTHSEDFWQAARGLAVALGYERLHAKTLNVPTFVMPAEAAGWISEPEDRMFVFSRPLSLVENADVEHPETPPIES